MQANPTMDRPSKNSSTNSGLCVEIQAIQFRNEENGWSVANARDQQNGQTMTVVGSFPFLRSGEVFEIFGQWIEHKKFGPQFKVERSVALRPKGVKEILKYLGSGIFKGIGPKTAKLIVAHFGEETMDILDHNPQKLLAVPNIGQKKLRQILEVWGEGQSQRDLQMFLTSHDISPNLAGKITKKYGLEAHRLIAKNPYRLATDISGIGFVKADKIAISIGIPTDSPERIQAAIIYILQQAADSGHCFLTTKDMITLLTDKLKLPSDTLIQKVAESIVI